jgi:hypothetical protein
LLLLGGPWWDSFPRAPCVSGGQVFPPNLQLRRRSLLWSYRGSPNVIPQTPTFLRGSRRAGPADAEAKSSDRRSQRLRAHLGAGAPCRLTAAASSAIRTAPTSRAPTALAALAFRPAQPARSAARPTTCQTRTIKTAIQASVTPSAMSRPAYICQRRS